MRPYGLLALALLLALVQFQTVRADGKPSCSFQPDGSIQCKVGGEGGQDDDGDDGGNDGPCTPGEHLQYQVLSYDAQAGACRAVPVWVDNCSGQVLESAGDAVDDLPCEFEPDPPDHPCEDFTLTPSGVICENFEWELTARVSFPPIYLDVRPYPATLVRWPTALRNGGLPQASGSGGKDYLPYGGGSPGNPHVGDWRGLRLTLTLRPAGMLFVSLPHVGELVLPDVGPTGNPNLVAWQVPSHPAVGGKTLAGSVGGLDELPADMPLFVGHGRAPYRLYWELRYFEYVAIKDCIPGPTGGGNYNCGGGTGHTEVVGYEWRRRTDGGEIPPAAVQGLPAALMADLNQDGTPDAYWDNNLTLRRMDDANRIDNPTYARSWSWGGTIYWAVREGQGQIGWPGQ
jgi:hypothetical protein